MPRIAAAALALALVACGDPASDSISPPAATLNDPGGSVDLNEVFKSALIGAPAGGAISWEIVSGSAPQAAYDAGLAISSTGRLTLPSCAYATTFGANFPVTFRVQASSGLTILLNVAITADERYISGGVACVIPSGETLCQDPTLPLTLEAGTTPQYYSRTQTSCRSVWTPALPAGACPLGAAYTFCL